MDPVYQPVHNAGKMCTMHWIMHWTIHCIIQCTVHRITGVCVLASPVFAIGSGSPPAQRPEPCSRSAWSAAAAETPAVAGSVHWSSDRPGWCCAASPADETSEKATRREDRCVCLTALCPDKPTDRRFQCGPFHSSSAALSDGSSSAPPFAAGASSAPPCTPTGRTAAQIPKRWRNTKQVIDGGYNIR